MLLYSWSKILDKADSISDIIKIMYGLTWPKPYRSKFHKQLFTLENNDYEGHSFLLDPNRLLGDSNSSNLEKVNYIHLASKRNLAKFLLTGEKRLDCRLVKVLPTENHLLTIENNYISFAYEQGKQ